MCPSYSLFISLEENLQPSSWSWLTSPQYDHHKLFSTTGIASTLMTKRITFKVSNSSARQHGRNLIQKREKMKEPDNYNGSLEEVNIWYQRMTMFFQSDNIENDWERIKITLERRQISKGDKYQVWFTSRRGKGSIGKKFQKKLDQVWVLIYDVQNIVTTTS